MKSLLDLTTDLLNEHGFAPNLKERIRLIYHRASQLEQKVGQYESEVVALRQQNAALKAENAVLKGKDPVIQSHPRDPHPPEKENQPGAMLNAKDPVHQAHPKDPHLPKKENQPGMDHCPFCKIQQGKLLKLKPHEVFGDIGIKIAYYRCEACGREYDRLHEGR